MIDITVSSLNLQPQCEYHRDQHDHDEPSRIVEGRLQSKKKPVEKEACHEGPEGTLAITGL
jgi:hypothetical protein